jgi:hypothetical protein
MQRALLVCWIGVLAPSAAALAQASGPDQSASWGIMASGEFTAGGSQNSTPGSGGAIGVLAQFPLESRVAIRIDAMVHYLTFNCGRGVVCGPGTPGSADASIVVRLNDLSRPWSPYLIAGGTGFIDAGANFGFAGGGGIEFRSSRHAYFAEARYISIERVGLIPITIGMRF